MSSHPQRVERTVSDVGFTDAHATDGHASDSGFAPVITGKARQAASIIESKAHRGAEAVTRGVHEAARKIERAAGYVQDQTIRSREAAAQAGETLKKHPGSIILAATVCGFALGLLARSSWHKPAMS